MQVELLRAWVSDLVGQNALLARTVTDLELEATASLQKQKQRFIEMASEHRQEMAALKRRLRRKDADLRGLLEVLRRLRDFDYYTIDGIHFHEGQATVRPRRHIQARQERVPRVPRTTVSDPIMTSERRAVLYQREMKTCGEREQEVIALNDVLQKENIAKDRELRRLNKELQQQESALFELRKELSNCRSENSKAPTADSGVMVGMSWLKEECGDMEPVRDRGPPFEEPNYQEKMKIMESKLKTTSKNVRTLRKANVSLSVELYATRCVCAALGEECAAARMNAEFKDEIVREMRRQLKQAKAKEVRGEIQKKQNNEIRSSKPSKKKIKKEYDAEEQHTESHYPFAHKNNVKSDKNHITQEINDGVDLSTNLGTQVPFSHKSQPKTSDVKIQKDLKQSMKYKELPDKEPEKENAYVSQQPTTQNQDASNQAPTIKKSKKTSCLPLRLLCTCESEQDLKEDNKTPKNQKEEKKTQNKREHKKKDEIMGSPKSGISPRESEESPRDRIKNKNDKNIEIEDRKSTKKNISKVSKRSGIQDDQNFADKIQNNDKQMENIEREDGQAVKKNISKVNNSKGNQDNQTFVDKLKNKIYKQKENIKSEDGQDAKNNVSKDSKSSGSQDDQSLMDKLQSNNNKQIENIESEDGEDTKNIVSKVGKSSGSPDKQTFVDKSQNKNHKKLENIEIEDGRDTKKNISKTRKSSSSQGNQNIVDKLQNKNHKQMELGVTKDQSIELNAISPETSILSSTHGSPRLSLIKSKRETLDDNKQLEFNDNIIKEQIIELDSMDAISSIPSSNQGSPRTSLQGSKTPTKIIGDVDTENRTGQTEGIENSSPKDSSMRGSPRFIKSYNKSHNRRISPAELATKMKEAQDQDTLKKSAKEPKQKPKVIKSPKTKRKQKVSSKTADPLSGSSDSECNCDELNKLERLRRRKRNKTTDSCSESLENLCDCCNLNKSELLEAKNTIQQLRQLVETSKSEKNDDKVITESQNDQKMPCSCEESQSDFSEEATKSSKHGKRKFGLFCFNKKREIKDASVGPDTPQDLKSPRMSGIEMVSKSSQFEPPPCPHGLECNCRQECDCSPSNCDCCPGLTRWGRPKYDVYVSQTSPIEYEEKRLRTVDLKSASSCSQTRDCDAQVSYYRDQLEAASKMLQEKEETIKFQSASLSLAEARASQLAAAQSDRRRPIYTQASVASQAQNKDNRAIIITLQEHLAIIEDLYRESFYESIKQDQLIELLRKSLREVRAGADCGEVGRLQNVVNKQKCELQRCQDIAAEVEGLKSEISNFLQSSNNDSGVWEEPVSPAEIVEDLREISSQLCSLQNMLAVRRMSPCTCGLEKENADLKDINNKMAMTVGELQGQVADLTSSLDEQTKKADSYLSQLKLRKFELGRSKEEVTELTMQLKNQTEANEKLKAQLQQSQEELRERCEEVLLLQQQSSDADLSGKQTASAPRSPESLRAQVLLYRRRLHDSDARAAELADRLAQSLHGDADRESCAPVLAALSARLAAARAAGAQLCEDAWRSVHAVRAWCRRMREHNQALKEKVKLQEQTILRLQEQLNYREAIDRPSSSERVGQKDCIKTRENEKKACCRSWNYPKSQTHAEAEKEYSSSVALSCSQLGTRHKAERSSSAGTSASCVSATELRSMKRNVPLGSTEAGSQATTSRHCTCTGEDLCLDAILERLQTAQLALMEGQGRWRREHSPPC